jgi:hypothetical protein
MEEVQLATFATWTEAAMWAALLEAEGIPVVLAPFGAGAVATGFSVFVPYALRVRADDAPRARQLLAAPPRRHAHRQGNAAPRKRGCSGRS